MNITEILSIAGIFLSISALMNTYIILQQGRKIEQLKHDREKDRILNQITEGMVTKIIQVLDANRIK